MRKMKDSGIEWIGQIPSDWDVIKLRYLIKGYKAGPFGSALITEKLEEDGSILVYTPEHIAEKTTNLEGNLYLPNERKNEMSQFFVKKNDIIFPIVGSLGRAMIIDETMPDGIINQRLAKFRLSSAKISIKFFLRLFAKSDFFTPYIDLYRRGSIILNLTKQIVYNMPIPIPPIDEQKKIADFLDEKCGEIDSIRSDIQKQIDILNDYKKSVITEAITKGLNPKAKLKDSGIEWIGKIPEHWNIKRLKYTATIVRGGSPRPIESFISDNDIGFNWVKIGDTEKGCKYITRTSCKIIPSGLSKTRMVHKNDLILTNSMSFGSPYIMGIDGCIHDGWVAFSNYKGVEKEFLYWCLSSNLCKTQFEKQVDGGVVQNLNIDKIGMTTIFLPPIEEQLTIVSHLNERCSEIDATIADKQRQLETLDEYKKSLIFEYVTGKKEVLQ